MYSMKEACVQTGMSYETLKFYCKEGLVPNVKRDSHNYRVFDDRDIKWIQSPSSSAFFQLSGIKVEKSGE